MIWLVIRLLVSAWAHFLLDLALILRFMILIKCDFCANDEYMRGRQGRPTQKPSLLQRYLTKFYSNSPEISKQFF